jgi:zinc protease
MRSLLLKFLLAGLAVVLLVMPAQAIAITEVKTPGGLTAWLVEDKTHPLISMQFSFRNGAASDPQGKEGVSHFLTGMLNEGAGDLDSDAFQSLMDELAFRMSFDAGFDYFEGSFAALSRNRDQSFDMLRLAVTVPRFEPVPLERVRQQFLLAAQGDREDPNKIASRAWMAQAFGGHPYGRPARGTEATMAKITADDLAAAHARIFTRRTLQIAVVGDIDAVSLAGLLDRTFGALPEGPEEPPVTRLTEISGPSLKVIGRNIPQSIIVFGHRGIFRDDPDFIPAYVMAEILGGSGFDSRFTEEVREKRGLTYGVGADLVPLRQAGLYLGSLGTRNEKAGEALALVKDVMRKMAEQGPTAQELQEAKTYLTGSYALRFDSSSKIANQLLGIQQQGLDIGYVDRRNSLIEALTLEQLKAQARRILRPDELIVTVVGQPEGIQ